MHESAKGLVQEVMNRLPDLWSVLLVIVVTVGYWRCS